MSIDREMIIENDPLVPVLVNKWCDLQRECLWDWPRSITGYYALETQREWLQKGIDYGFKVFCPFGEPRNGFICIVNKKQFFNAIIIECPSDDTTKLEEAMKSTNQINWGRKLSLVFVSKHIRSCVERIVDQLNIDLEVTLLKLYILDKGSPLFNVSIPADMTFMALSFDHIDLIDSKWLFRYPGSRTSFEFLIRANQGYGLFKNSELIAWIFIKEIGALGHLYTIEDHRRKGYGEITLKLICNVLLRMKKSVYSFCLVNNVASCSLHEKLGFSEFREFASCYSTNTGFLF